MWPQRQDVLIQISHMCCCRAHFMVTSSCGSIRKLLQREIHTEATSERAGAMRGEEYRRALSDRNPVGSSRSVCGKREGLRDWDRDGEMNVRLKKERRYSQWRTFKEGQQPAVCGALAECFSGSALRAQPEGSTLSGDTHWYRQYLYKY